MRASEAYLVVVVSFLKEGTLVLDKVLSCHLCGLLETHDVKDAWSNVSKNTVRNLGILVFCNVDERNGVERVSSVD